MSIGLSFWGFPSPFALLPAFCLPLCLDVARYAFDKGDSQSARQQNEIALDSNDRFGLKPDTKGQTDNGHYSAPEDRPTA